MPKRLALYAKAYITPEEEFIDRNTLHKERGRAKIHRLTDQAHYRRVERNSEQRSCEERNLINVGQRDTDRA